MKFIVFEGLDGSGKSSLMNALESHLRARDISLIRTREPGGTELGDEIRELILRTKGQAPTARTELLLYEASRSQHVELVIKPAIKEKKWVLCDRYTASSVAFQAGGREIQTQWVEKLNDFATDFVKPDLTVLLDLTVDESRRRRNQRSLSGGDNEDRMESEADTFHTKVRNSFLHQAQQDQSNWLVLNAAETPEKLLSQLLAHLKKIQWLSF